MTNKLLISILPGFILFFTSCKIYYIPVESFKQQLSISDTTKMREVTTRGPFGDKETYKIYPIDIIHAVDKNGNEVDIKNSPAIEIRITEFNNNRTIFYFDLLQFDGENIIGRRSRLIPSIKKVIPISTITKVEVQDGRKKYRYIQ